MERTVSGKTQERAGSPCTGINQLLPQTRVESPNRDAGNSPVQHSVRDIASGFRKIAQNSATRNTSVAVGDNVQLHT